MNRPLSNRAGGHVVIENLRITLGDDMHRFVAVQDVSIDIAPGEFVCLLGPSGCGKSTLLGVLAGHIAPSHGHATLDGKPIEGPRPERGMVFQHHTLFPWRKTLENVAFGLKMQGMGRSARHHLATQWLERVGLGDFAGRYPSQLSGGMQQRAEIARAMITGPRILLMDEPFGALDAQTRAMMQALLLDVWSEQRPTVVFVTHDIDEALFLGDRVLVMSPGPGTIIEDLRVPFARPRLRDEAQDLVTQPEFVALKRHLLTRLRHQQSPLPAPRLNPLGDLRSSPASLAS
ncbi:MULTISPECIES: ABC transporter ATP-binding protein [Pandoraea]|uniref:ABC transporter ATP-binding protein n=1 Tax=Pandoraea TaxID=93217 RepID=UPI001F5E0884|nr:MULTISPECIES: ABC transporter ATP-binding protein [Pandoraea]MCI3206756.1 sulfonate ABC transporter ATP-binding protein [Pandoraea sp. LA3]MDN4584784.1 sulfonate ABC transporter ATP-binding protein [Pandoraea capi]